MRHMLSGWVAGAALAATMAVSSAQACAVSGPCHEGHHVFAFMTDYAYAIPEHLPDLLGPLAHGRAPQYYYVNQGPFYSGPGNFAPVPTYQERAVTGWQTYREPYYYGYYGGPYANATHHFYDGAPNVQGPVVYTYRHGRRHVHSRAHHPAPRAHHVRRSSVVYGYTAPGSYDHSMALSARANRMNQVMGPGTRGIWMP